MNFACPTVIRLVIRSSVLYRSLRFIRGCLPCKRNGWNKKAKLIGARLEHCNNNWEDVFLHHSCP